MLNEDLLHCDGNVHGPNFRLKKYSVFVQILMSALKKLITVILMQLVTTHLEATHAHVILATAEMGLHAQVSEIVN